MPHALWPLVFLFLAMAASAIASQSVCTGHKLAYKNMACCGDSNMTATCVAPTATTTATTTNNMTRLCNELFNVDRIHHYSLEPTAGVNGTYLLVYRHKGSYRFDAKVHNSTACEWRTTALSDDGSISFVSVSIPPINATNATNTPLATITTRHAGTINSSSTAFLVGPGAMSLNVAKQQLALTAGGTGRRNGNVARFDAAFFQKRSSENQSDDSDIPRPGSQGPMCICQCLSIVSDNPWGNNQCTLPCDDYRCAF